MMRGLGFLVLNFMKINEVLVKFYLLELELNPAKFHLSEKSKWGKNIANEV